MDLRKSPMRTPQFPRAELGLKDRRPRVNEIWLTLGKYETACSLLVERRNGSWNRKAVI